MKDDNLLTVRVDTVNKGTLHSTILLAPRLLGLRLEKKEVIAHCDCILIIFFFQKSCRGFLLETIPESASHQT